MMQISEFLRMNNIKTHIFQRLLAFEIHIRICIFVVGEGIMLRKTQAELITGIHITSTVTPGIASAGKIPT